jgi:xanthine dehydrogenase accessory factor
MRFAKGLLVRPLVPGIAPRRVSDRAFIADWPLPVLRIARQMLSGERPREVILIAPRKGEPAWLIEPEPRPRHPLYIYGAGHVGRAVVRALQPLPFSISWIDVADERFPRSIPANVQTISSADPAATALTAPADALHLIMTFSHALDLAICHAVLSRDFLWAGLIGSVTKRARFERRLRQGGIDERAIAGLQCPIGIGGITAKEPAMIAVSVAAQLAAVITSSQIRAQTGGQKHGA